MSCSVATNTKFTNAGVNLSNDTGAGIKANHQVFGGKLGATHVAPSTNNGMEIEFTVVPHGIGGEPGIVFDITRRKESKAWTVNGGVVAPLAFAGVVPSVFPAVADSPNDDGGIADEDNDPKNDHIYATDHPGQNGNNAFADRFVMRFNFDEFVRVLVNGGAFANNNRVVEGSRCSNYIPWRSRMDVIKNAAGKWQRNGKDNEIELNHKAIGNAPSP